MASRPALDASTNERTNRAAFPTTTSVCKPHARTHKLRDATTNTERLPLPRFARRRSSSSSARRRVTVDAFNRAAGLTEKTFCSSSYEPSNVVWVAHMDGNSQLNRRVTPPTMSTTPWPMTRVPAPVYSLATTDSMNIVTFATPVAIEPKRRFVVALYADTRSHANFILNGGPATLQVLRKDAHEGLIDLLGRTRADSIDGGDGKLRMIRARASTRRRETNGVEVLSDALAVFDLEIVSVTNAGDHDVVICDVTGWACGDDGEEEMQGACLTTLDVV